MKRFLGKMFGVLLTVAILMSLIPATVVSAESTGMVKSLSRFRVFLNGDSIGLSEPGTSVFIAMYPDSGAEGFLVTGGSQSVTISENGSNVEVVLGGNSDSIVITEPGGSDALKYIEGEGTSNEDLMIFTTISIDQAVKELIDQIPETITVEYEDIIVAARAAYDRAGELDVKIDSELAAKLENAESDLQEIKDEKAAQEVADNEVLAKTVADKIAALPDSGDVTIEDQFKIQDALDYYNDLTSEQKDLISDELKAKLNSDLIAVYLLIIDQYYKLGETLINDYGNVMSEDSNAKLQAAMDNADDVLNSGVMSSDNLEEAIYDLVIALIEADEELEGIYTITDDSGAQWAQGSTTGLTFRIVQEGISDDAYDFFEDGGCYIEVDGKVLDISLFTYEKGSVIITIMPELLKTLSIGEHTITITFSNATVTTKFNVTPASSVPASGESVSTAAIAGVSVIALAGVVLFMRKRYAAENN